MSFLDLHEGVAELFVEAAAREHTSERSPMSRLRDARTDRRLARESLARRHRAIDRELRRKRPVYVFQCCAVEFDTCDICGARVRYVEVAPGYHDGPCRERRGQ